MNYKRDIVFLFIVWQPEIFHWKILFCSSCDNKRDLINEHSFVYGVTTREITLNNFFYCVKTRDLIKEYCFVYCFFIEKSSCDNKRDLINEHSFVYGVTTREITLNNFFYCVKTREISLKNIVLFIVWQQERFHFIEEYCFVHGVTRWISVKNIVFLWCDNKDDFIE